jgi:pyruvate/2-oxoglutarate dehydrogenase complex dihydrolipoamide acyltransferase (E2) component
VIVVKWLKRKGQKVRLGEPLVELQTDKVNYELESTADGELLEIVAKGDSEVPVGELLCYIGQPGETVPKSWLRRSIHRSPIASLSRSMCCPMRKRSSKR